MSKIDIEDLFGILKREFALLSPQLQFYWQLFSVEHSDRRKLMEENAGDFFRMFELCLIESILLRIARLMDPPGSKDQQNASMARLLMTLDTKSVLRLRWKGLCRRWQHEDFKPVCTLRNKFLAHNDETNWTNRERSDAWLPVAETDVEAMHSLFDELWALFRDAHRERLGTDVALADNGFGRPTQILRILAGTSFLTKLLERRDDLDDEWARLSEHIRDKVGNDAA